MVKKYIAVEPIYIGIDPGKSGAIVTLGYSSSPTIYPMPPSERDLWAIFEPLQALEVVAVLEKVGGYVGDKGAANGSAMFNFGQGVGRLEMALTAAGIPYERITPQTWQRKLSVGNKKKGETKRDWKNRLKAHAQRLFPQEQVTLSNCDALLIALYCKRKHEGTL